MNQYVAGLFVENGSYMFKTDPQVGRDLMSVVPV